MNINSQCRLVFLLRLKPQTFPIWQLRTSNIILWRGSELKYVLVIYPRIVEVRKDVSVGTGYSPWNYLSQEKTKMDTRGCLWGALGSPMQQGDWASSRGGQLHVLRRVLGIICSEVIKARRARKSIYYAATYLWIKGMFIYVSINHI